MLHSVKLGVKSSEDKKYIVSGCLTGRDCECFETLLSAHCIFDSVRVANSVLVNVARIREVGVVNLLQNNDQIHSYFVTFS